MARQRCPPSPGRNASSRADVLSIGVLPQAHRHGSIPVLSCPLPPLSGDERARGLGPHALLQPGIPAWWQNLGTRGLAPATSGCLLQARSGGRTEWGCWAPCTDEGRVPCPWLARGVLTRGTAPSVPAPNLSQPTHEPQRRAPDADVLPEAATYIHASLLTDPKFVI